MNTVVQSSSQESIHLCGTKMAEEKYPLVNLKTRIYDFLEKAHKACTIKEIVKELSREGYKSSTVEVTVSTLIRTKVLESYEGSGIVGDPNKYYLCANAVRPEPLKPYRGVNRLTATQKKDKQYKANKAAQQLILDAQAKKAINKALKTIPATTNNSIASEIQRLHLGEMKLKAEKTPEERANEQLKVAFKTLEDAGMSASMELRFNWEGRVLSLGELREIHKKLEEDYLKLSKVVKLVEGL